MTAHYLFIFYFFIFFRFWPIHIFNTDTKIYTSYYYKIIYNIDRAALEQAYGSLCKLGKTMDNILPRIYKPWLYILDITYHVFLYFLYYFINLLYDLMEKKIHT